MAAEEAAEGVEVEAEVEAEAEAEAEAEVEVEVEGCKAPSRLVASWKARLSGNRDKLCLLTALQKSTSFTIKFFGNLQFDVIRSIKEF